MDSYADDLAQLVEKLDLKETIHVGHSTGGAEVARYMGRHGTKRVANAVLIGAAAADAEDPSQSRRLADGHIRPDSYSRPYRSRAVFQRPQRSVLCSQQAGRQGLARPAGMCSTLKDHVNSDLLGFFQRSDHVAA